MVALPSYFCYQALYRRNVSADRSQTATAPMMGMAHHHGSAPWLVPDARKQDAA
jgi:hypothetical protein